MFLKESLLIGELVAGVHNDRTLKYPFRRLAVLGRRDLEYRGRFFVFRHECLSSLKFQIKSPPPPPINNK